MMDERVVGGGGGDLEEGEGEQVAKLYIYYKT